MFKEEIIAIIKKDKKLVEFENEIDEKDKNTNEQIDFLKKKAEAIHKQHVKWSKKYWQRLENYLQQEGYMPDWYDPKYHNIGFVRGALMIIDKRNKPNVPPFLQAFAEMTGGVVITDNKNGDKPDDKK